MVDVDLQSQATRSNRQGLLIKPASRRGPWPAIARFLEPAWSSPPEDKQRQPVSARDVRADDSWRYNAIERRRSLDRRCLCRGENDGDQQREQQNAAAPGDDVKWRPCHNLPVAP